MNIWKCKRVSEAKKWILETQRKRQFITTMVQPKAHTRDTLNEVFFTTVLAE